MGIRRTLVGSGLLSFKVRLSRVAEYGGFTIKTLWDSGVKWSKYLWSAHGRSQGRMWFRLIIEDESWDLTIDG